MEDQAKKNKPFYKKVWVIIIVVFILVVVIANIFDTDEKSSSKDTSSSATTTTETTNKEESNWQYSEDVDKMTNEKSYFARCVSTNEIDFEFPYNGGSSFTLILRNKGKYNEIILQVSKGQFMTSIMSSDYCRVKFDDEETINYTYNSAEDGSADFIFFDHSKNFLTKLRSAKKLMIEAPFFDSGRQIINFDVEGLVWDK